MFPWWHLSFIRWLLNGERMEKIMQSPILLRIGFAVAWQEANTHTRTHIYTHAQTPHRIHRHREKETERQLLLLGYKYQGKRVWLKQLCPPCVHCVNNVMSFKSHYYYKITGNYGMRTILYMTFITIFKVYMGAWSKILFFQRIKDFFEIKHTHPWSINRLLNNHTIHSQ